MIGSTALTPAEPPKESARPIHELNADELRFSSNLSRDFTSTRDLTRATEFVGQERALAALELGLGIGSNGYNIFVAGLTGTEKLETVRRWVAERAASSATPGDWVYVHNFKQPDAPRAIYLKPNEGKRLREMMRDLVKTLREELPKAFRQEAFEKEKSSLTEKYNNHAQDLNAQFAALARERSFQLQTSGRGHIYFAPVVDGKPLRRPQDFAALPEDQRREVEKRQQELSLEMERLARKQQEIVREMEEDIHAIEQRFCESLLAPIVQRIEYELGNDEVNLYLAEDFVSVSWVLPRSVWNTQMATFLKPRPRRLYRIHIGIVSENSFDPIENVSRYGHPRTKALLYPTQVEAAGTDPDEVVKKL